MDFATPIKWSFVTYYDNPSKSLEELDEFTYEQTLLFIKGYIQACCWFKEIFGDARRRLVTGALGKNAGTQKRIMSYVELLDEFEEQADDKAKQLNDLLQSSVDT